MPLLRAVPFAVSPGAMFPGTAASQTRVAVDLTELSLEELADIKITSVSKKPEDLSPTPAAIQEVFRHVAELPYQLSVVGQNLLQPRHGEFEHDHDPQVVVQIRRSVYAQVRWAR